MRNFQLLLLTLVIGCTNQLSKGAVSSSRVASDDTVSFLEDENRHADAFFNESKFTTEEIVRELEELEALRGINNDVFVGSNRFQILYDFGVRYPIISRTGAEGNAVSVDLNNQFPSQTANIEALRISPDGAKVAIIAQLQEIKGSRLLVVSIDSGAGNLIDIPDIFDAVWGRDSSELFVSTGSSVRADTIFRVVNGSSSKILQISNPNSSLILERTENGSYVVAKETDRLSSKITAFPTGVENASAIRINRCNEGAMCSLHEAFGRLLLVNARGGVSSLETLDSKNFGTLSESSPEFFIESARGYSKFLLLFGRLNGYPTFYVIDRNGVELFHPNFVDKAYKLTLLPDSDFDSEIARFVYSSPEKPESLAIYDNRDHSFEVTPSHGAKVFQALVRRDVVKSKDGTEIPISFVLPSKVESSKILVLSAYGAYGTPLDVGFSPKTQVLLAHGVGSAYCHVRGGGEFGPRWHEAGRGVNRMKSVEDFDACISHVVHSGMVPEGKLILSGRSAGGLLVGDALNKSQGKLAGAILDAPFLDPLGISSTESAELDYQEWGDPAIPNVHKVLSEISPIDGIRGVNFPPIYIRASISDLSVPFKGPFNWVKKLHSASPQSEVIFEISDVPHQGSGIARDALISAARDIQFALSVGMP